MIPSSSKHSGTRWWCIPRAPSLPDRRVWFSAWLRPTERGAIRRSMTAVRHLVDKQKGQSSDMSSDTRRVGWYRRFSIGRFLCTSRTRRWRNNTRNRRQHVSNNQVRLNNLYRLFVNWPCRVCWLLRPSPPARPVRFPARTGQNMGWPARACAPTTRGSSPCHGFR